MTMWHVLDFFFSVCSVVEASIRVAASACPVSENGSGSVLRDGDGGLVNKRRLAAGI